MPASQQRREKRSEEHHERHSKRPKHGRQEKRQLTRKIGERRRRDEPEQVVEEEPQSESEEEEEEVQEEEIEDTKGQTYDALLTLLNAEHSEPEKKKSKKKQEKEETILEGFEDEEEEEEEELAEVDDSDDESDSFEVHFGHESVDLLDKAFKDRSVRYKSAKVTHGETTMTLSQPDAVEVEIPTYNTNYLKQKLRLNNDLTFTPLQKQLKDGMFNYQDMLYEYGKYEDENEIRDLYALHALNHVYKTRDRILKNNYKLSQDDTKEFLDQGFTRPKVLILAPTRYAAYEIVNRIFEKSGLEQVENKKKFYDQFKDDSLPPSSKPSDFQHVFKGNTNDFFVMGLKFTRKSIKCFSNFFASDIIVASPLGLQLIVENPDKKKREEDFLSSIELMIIDQLHSIEMQNFQHLVTIMQHTNTIPKQHRDVDFSRIRMWYINEQAKYYRQTLIFTKFMSPNAQFLLNKCTNFAGKWKSHTNTATGTMNGIKLKQQFVRFDPLTPIDEPDQRFKFFTSVMVPQMVQSTTDFHKKLLLYIPDYTDYVRVRNYLKNKTKVLFGDINEYSSQSQLTSNRAAFARGQCKVLLYTERLHHFRRYDLKGVSNVLFYKVPSNPVFYTEMTRMVVKNAMVTEQDINLSQIKAIYSKMDGLLLEKIVGTKRAAIMCHGQNEVFEFK